MNRKYILAALAAIVVIVMVPPVPVILAFVVPIVLLVAVKKNSYQITEKIPVVSDNTWKAAFAVSFTAFIAMLIIAGVAGSIGPGLESPDDDPVAAEATDTPEPTETPEPTSTPTAEPTATAEATPTEEPDDFDDADDAQLDAQTVESLYESVTMDNAPEHSDMEVFAMHQGDVFWVEVETYVRDEGDLIHQMAVLMGGYAGVVDQGHGGDGMEVDLYNHQGEYAGSFYVDYEYAEAYANDEIDEEEYMEHALENFESA